MVGLVGLRQKKSACHQELTTGARDGRDYSAQGHMAPHGRCIGKVHLAVLLLKAYHVHRAGFLHGLNYRAEAFRDIIGDDIHTLLP